MILPGVFEVVVLTRGAITSRDVSLRNLRRCNGCEIRRQHSQAALNTETPAVGLVGAQAPILLTFEFRPARHHVPKEIRVHTATIVKQVVQLDEFQDCCRKLDFTPDSPRELILKSTTSTTQELVKEDREHVTIVIAQRAKEEVDATTSAHYVRYLGPRPPSKRRWALAQGHSRPIIQHDNAIFKFNLDDVVVEHRPWPRVVPLRRNLDTKFPSASIT
jgi:hypothetical protein